MKHEYTAHSPLTDPNTLDYPLGRGSFRLGPYPYFAVIAFCAMCRS